MATETKKRPNAAQRRSSILAAAATVFFEQGYSAASVDSILEITGGSKRTIYNEFGSKEGIFTALVSQAAEGALAMLNHDESSPLAIRDVLIEFSRSVMEIYVSPTMIGVYRIIVTEAQRFPDLARSFYENGPGRAEQNLAKALERAVAKGEVSIVNTRLAASHFVGMLRDNFHLQIVLGLAAPPSQEQVEEHLVSAVDIFLGGIEKKTKNATR